jgi:hypothetical protein
VSTDKKQGSMLSYVHILSIKMHDLAWKLITAGLKTTKVLHTLRINMVDMG